MDRKEIADLVDTYAALLEEELDAATKLESTRDRDAKDIEGAITMIDITQRRTLVAQLEHDAAHAIIRRKAHQAYLALVRAWLYSQIKL